MTIFYFTSTGNSLAVAKRIGGDLVSIPQIIDGNTRTYKDDVIGVIFPIYGFFVPKMLRRFFAEITLTADYIFAIGTYGNLPGACMRNVQIFAQKHGTRIDYAESLLMIDNYLPGFEVKDQIAALPKKKTEQNLDKIIADISARKPLTAAASVGQRMATAVIQVGTGLFMNGKQAQNYIINGNCVKCGICSKICPAGNIAVADTVLFSDKCEGCLGCVHLCPKNAIHMKGERSTERWRNPEVSLDEIIEANNRGK